jgi:dTDP-glucose 4,6-dehydratase
MIIHALQGKPMPIYGDGLNVRDWLYVGDHCRALLEVLRRGQIGQTYNVGGGAERTNKEVVREICAIIDGRFSSDLMMKTRFPFSPAAGGKSCAELVTPVSDRPGHDRRYAISGDFLRQSLDVAPREDFQSGLRQTVSWYMENEAWWQRALSQDFGQWMERNYTLRDTSRD